VIKIVVYSIKLPFQEEVSMNKHNQLIAVCGLNCNECDIFKATNNPVIAQEIVDWLKKERDTEAKIEDIRCLGCKGDRTKHWSPDCWILKCCVDKPCEKLDQWAKGSKGYKEALNRLKEIKGKSLDSNFSED
jgi:hypothetical protein